MLAHVDIIAHALSMATACKNPSYMKLRYTHKLKISSTLGYAKGTSKRGTAHTNHPSETESPAIARTYPKKTDNIEHTVTWEILQTAPAGKCGSKRCNLCISEKYHIMTANKSGLLNRRNELISKCRHINKHLLASTIKKECFVL